MIQGTAANNSANIRNDDPKNVRQSVLPGKTGLAGNNFMKVFPINGGDDRDVNY